MKRIILLLVLLCGCSSNENCSCGKPLNSILDSSLDRCLDGNMSEADGNQDNATRGTGGIGGSGGESASDGGTSDGGFVIVLNKYSFKPCPGVIPAEPAGLSSLPICSISGYVDTAHRIPGAQAGNTGKNILLFSNITSDGEVCIPDAITYVNGKAVLKDCSTSNGKCFPSIFTQNAILVDSQDCSNIESCALCADPNTGSSTGACDDLCQ